MPDASSLYPAPPQQQPQQNSLLSNPMNAVGILNNLVELQRRQQELNAKNAVGRATQGAIGPTGDYDPSAAMTAVKNDPNAAYGAPDAVTQMLQQRQQQIQNGKTQFELAAGQNKFVTDQIGALADDPNLNINTVRNHVVTAARNTGIPPDILTAWVNGLPKDPKRLRQYMVGLRNMTMGASATGQPQEVVGYGPDGRPIMGTVGGYNYNAAGGAPPQTGIPGLPPGFTQRQQGYAQTDTALADQWANTAEGSPARRAILGNLEDTLQQFTSGPGADWTKVGKAFVNRNVPLPAGWQFDPKSIASQEEFVKQAETLAQQQFGAIGGTGTDAKFNSAYATSPHETLSALGNKGIVRLLKANEDAIAAKNNAFLMRSAQDPTLSARRFSAEFNQNFDPRAFQFKYMSPDERKSYFAKMDANDQQRFLHDLTYARKQGWISFESPK